MEEKMDPRTLPLYLRVSPSSRWVEYLTPSPSLNEKATERKRLTGHKGLHRKEGGCGIQVVRGDARLGQRPPCSWTKGETTVRAPSTSPSLYTGSKANDILSVSKRVRRIFSPTQTKRPPHFTVDFQTEVRHQPSSYPF